MDRVEVRSFFPHEHTCWQGHKFHKAVDPLGFRVWHSHRNLDGEATDEDPIVTCSLHLAAAVRAKEEEGRRVEVREEIVKHVNKGVDLLIDSLCLGERDQILLHLAANAIAHVVVAPGASLDDVIRANYSEPPEEVKEWLDS